MSTQQHTDQAALREQVRARYAAAATKVTSGQGDCGCGPPADCGCGDGCCGAATAEGPGFGAPAGSTAYNLSAHGPIIPLGADHSLEERIIDEQFLT